MYRKITATIFVFILILNLSACEKENHRYQASFLELFDTVTTIIGYAGDKADFTGEAQMIYDNLMEYHQLYDIYNTYDGMNNIKTINDNAGKAPVKVDQKIIELLLFAREAYELTDGKVNVAFGAVLSVWHDYRETGLEDPDAAMLPPMDLLEEMAQHTDINKMVIDEKASTVYLEDAGMSLDVGAIAKGFATEQVTRLMTEKGFTNLLISVGGNVRAIGHREEKEEDWNVGIQNPDLESVEPYLMVVRLQDLSLVSSGDYERYYTVDGKEYHHIINSETLMPAEYFTAVSIIAEDSGLSDALSTAIFNMPLSDGQKLIEAIDGTEAMWVMKNEDITYSSGFQRYVK